MQNKKNTLNVTFLKKITDITIGFIATIFRNL